MRTPRPALLLAVPVALLAVLTFTTDSPDSGEVVATNAMTPKAFEEWNPPVFDAAGLSEVDGGILAAAVQADEERRAAEYVAAIEAEKARRAAAAEKARKAREESARQVHTRTSPTPAGVWDRLAQCESNGNWQINTGNGYYGGLQFNLSTWRAYGGTGYPHQHSRETQIAVAQRLHAARGFQPWPACSRKLGLR